MSKDEREETWPKFPLSDYIAKIEGYLKIAKEEAEKLKITNVRYVNLPSYLQEGKRNFVCFEVPFAEFPFQGTNPISVDLDSQIKEVIVRTEIRGVNFKAETDLQDLIKNKKVAALLSTDTIKSIADTIKRHLEQEQLTNTNVCDAETAAWRNQEPRLLHKKEVFAKLLKIIADRSDIPNS
jgi:hypothetical protein